VRARMGVDTLHYPGHADPIGYYFPLGFAAAQKAMKAALYV